MSNWKDSDSNVAGVSLSKLSQQTIAELHQDILNNNNVQQLMPKGCMVCALSGERPRKYVTIKQITREKIYWQGLSSSSPQCDLYRENADYWKRAEEAYRGTTKKGKKESTDGAGKNRGNTGVLVYHLACARNHGLPEKNTNASHLCGNPKCLNPAHLRWETMQYNGTRNYCFYMKNNNPNYDPEKHCLHSPKCIV